MNNSDAPIYLAVNNCTNENLQNLGSESHNKLNSLMRKMAEKARLGPNVKYHSCCKQSTQFILETDHLSGMGLGKEL